jgi:hypothetical protein
LDVTSGNGIRLGLQGSGGGALVLANNFGDNRIYLEGFNTDSNGSAAEMLLTGFAGGPIPQITLRAGNTAMEGSATVRGRLVLNSTVEGTGLIESFSPAGLIVTSLTHVGGFPGHGFITVGRPGNDRAGRMYVGSDNISRVEANVKNFREINPADPALDIVYACIEGPEAAMYVRGTGQLTSGRAVITLPDHFKALASANGITVQLTPLSANSKGLAVVRKSLDGIEVQELLSGSGQYEFDWEVKAVRKRHENYRVIQPWDEALPAGTDREKAWNSRLNEFASAENGAP